MKHPFLLLLLLAASLTLSAQCDPDFSEIFDLAKQSLQARDYQLAIARLLDARDICPDRKAEVNVLIKQAFAQIEGEKETAEREKRRADSALNVANSVLDQMYFYEGKFGLTLKNIGRSFDPKYRYGYIDRAGKEVIPFTFEEASPFSYQDGFARVTQEGKKYLLDTLGRTYLLAESLSALTPETQALDVHEENLVELPDSLGKYTSLHILLAYRWGGRGRLKEIPASIGKLTHLQTLSLRSNQLSSLPESFGQLQGLQSLDLNRNQLSSLPESFGQLQGLQTLYLNRNKLSSLPESFGQLQGLQSLDLRSNQLGSLPESFGQLKGLQSLDLRSNQLGSLPESFGQLQGLQSLYLSSNQLSSLPEEITQLQGLQELSLSGNQLSSLPESFGQLQGLQELSLSGNQLSSLPESFGQLQGLQSLDLSGNKLANLPESFGQLQGLQSLYLSGNKLANLPESFGQLQGLQTLDFSSNQLESLPESFGQLQGLQLLYLYGNKLESLPESMVKLIGLNVLDLRENQLADSTLLFWKEQLPNCVVRFQTLVERKKGNLEKLEQYRQEVAAVEEALNTQKHIDSTAAANTYNGLGWYQLLTGDFAGAEVSLGRGIALDSGYAYLYSNLAPSLLLQGRVAEARAEYLKWKDKPFRGKTYKVTFLGDLRELERAGVIPPELQEAVEEIRVLLEE